MCFFGGVSGRGEASVVWWVLGGGCVGGECGVVSFEGGERVCVFGGGVSVVW